MTGRSLDYSNQIAYNVEPAVKSVVEAYLLTGDEKYKTLAAILSSWFFGNNTARIRFYSEESGICFDGTIDSIHVNRNSGAESTIEALLTFVEIHRMGEHFHTVVLASFPSFTANGYFYRIDQKRTEIKMGHNGFSIR